ncbi:MAG: hypothetical protein JW723_06455 [Bacteroidales bacterium]|nr:hypothetical protein [Bacteroidales bacterium]
MKTDRMIKTGFLPLAAVLLSMIFIPGQSLHGQDKKAEKGQPDVRIDVKREFDEQGNISRYDSSYSFSWSYNGSMDMDSLLESLRNRFGITPFNEDEFFSMPFKGHPHFHMFPHGHVYPEAEDDSLYGYIDPSDSVYFFNRPYHFFDSPFDMRGMLENHRRMMEELHQFFEFDLPRYHLMPDSIPRNYFQQKYHRRSGSLPEGQEI